MHDLGFAKMQALDLRLIACGGLTAALAAGSGLFLAAGPPSSDPFAFLAPEIVVSGEDRQRLDRDEAIARILHGESGQVAVFVATRLQAPPDALAVWTRAIAELKRSRFVIAIHRFSDPPEPGDVADLLLDERDLESIRRCAPADCSLKLTAPEIISLQAAIAAGGADWRRAVQVEFRRLVVQRVNLYRKGGLGAVPPMADRSQAVRLQDAFEEILERSPFVRRLPTVPAWLSASGNADRSVESFFYWSKESYGSGKPIISVTHVGMVRPPASRDAPVILVAGKQILATHYLEGSLGLTMVVQDQSNGVPYLLYINRSRVDMLRGFWGRFIRGALEDRLERDAPRIVRALRARLESGSVPANGSHRKTR